MSDAWALQESGVRLRREDWSALSPGDVEWVTEWQLAAGVRWLPVRTEQTVVAARMAGPGARTWSVTVCVGASRVTVPLPLRDLARVIHWCHSLRSPEALRRPPAGIQGNLLALRRALRSGLRAVDPLDRMGYVAQEQSTPDA